VLPKRRSDFVALALLAGCLPAGCLPPETPAAPKPLVDADLAELAHAWNVSAHVVGTKTTISEQDAVEMHGRTVTIGAGYTSPWHGSCEQANRTKQTSSLVEITADVDLSPAGRATAKEFGLAKDVTEYKLTCATSPNTPPLTIYLTGKRAMTCFGGVCYLLTRN